MKAREQRVRIIKYMMARIEGYPEEVALLQRQEEERLEVATGNLIDSDCWDLALSLIMNAVGIRWQNRIAMFALDSVLPIFERALPGDRMPRKLLDAMILDMKTGEDEEIKQLREDCFEIAESLGPTPAGFVAYAAAYAGYSDDFSSITYACLAVRPRDKRAFEKKLEDFGLRLLDALSERVESNSAEIAAISGRRFEDDF